MGGWDGHTSSRRRITQCWDYANVCNAVVGSEPVCTSITSITSTGKSTGSPRHRSMPWNPHMKFYKRQLAT